MLESEDKEKDNSNTIDYSEFEQIMCLKMGAKETREEVEKAFLLFDKDETGKISLENLREIANEIGEKLTDDELMDMLIEANPANDTNKTIDI